MAASDWRGIRDACALLEDEAVLALNKPAGLPLVGGRHEPDLVTLARDAGERLLPVHRLDKVTSGAVLLAKQPRAHADLAHQFSRRTVGKAYWPSPGRWACPSAAPSSCR
jgi:tRNA pseudouridine32 synthase / 23S rRNA pseudouridine746 synthase